MSADNWAICPRCKLGGEVEHQGNIDRAAEAYGKVDPDEYEALREIARRPLDLEPFRTFREDYEFYGADEGTVVATYEGECSVCSLHVKFRHERQFFDRETGSVL